MAFVPDMGGGFIGGFNFLALFGVGTEVYPVYSDVLTHLSYMVFQLMLTIITVAIIACPFAERVNFKAFVIFITNLVV